MQKSKGHCFIQLKLFTMDVQLSEVRCVAVTGFKATFQVPPGDVIWSDGHPFIRLRSESHTLTKLVYEQNPDAPEVMKGEYASLANCQGLQQLIQLRNAAQAQELAPEAGSNLFENPAGVQKKTQQPIMTRLELQQKRAADHLSISIQVPLEGASHSIMVLRPVQAKDALYVIYDKDALSVVLQYLRHNGFSEPQPKFKHQGAKGIQKRVGGYVVISKDDEGKKHFKRVKNLGKAIEVQSGGAPSAVSEDAWDAQPDGAEVEPEAEAYADVFDMGDNES